MQGCSHVFRWFSCGIEQELMEDKPVGHIWARRKGRITGFWGEKARDSYAIPLIYLQAKSIYFIQSLAKWEEQKKCHSTLEHKVTVDSASTEERNGKQVLNYRVYTECEVFMIKHFLSHVLPSYLMRESICSQCIFWPAHFRTKIVRLHGDRLSYFEYKI